MITGKRVKELLEKGEFVPSKTRVALTPGESVRIIRELQESSACSFTFYPGRL